MKWWAIVFAIIKVCVSYASNFHDHLSLLPSLEDATLAYSSATKGNGIQMLDFKAKGIISPTMIYANFGEQGLTSVYGQELAKDLLQGVSQRGFSALVQNQRTLESTWSLYNENMSLKELGGKIADRLSTDSKPLRVNDVLNSFFETTEKFDFSPSIPQDKIYLNRLIARQNLNMTVADRVDFQKYKKYTKKMYSRALSKIPINDRRIITASSGFSELGAKFGDREMAQLIEELHETFRNKGTRLELLVGITRKNFAGGLDRFLPQVADLLKKDLIQGVDLSGAISEAFDDLRDPGASERFKKSLDSVVRLLSKSDPPGSLRLHMFQDSLPRHGGGNSTYKAFWEVLEELALDEKLKPVNIRVGHISALTSRDVARFKELAELNPNMRFFFEANIASNEFVQGSKIRDLAEKINELTRNGLKVVLGEDGKKLLNGDAGFEETLKRLSQNGLSQQAHDNIIKTTADAIAQDGLGAAVDGRPAARLSEAGEAARLEAQRRAAAASTEFLEHAGGIGVRGNCAIDPLVAFAKGQ